MRKVNAASSTFEKLEIMYNHIVLRAEFSLDPSGYNATIYNGLAGSGALQCAGYAKTMQYFCDLAGIQSTVIVGSDETNASHAWNAIYCDDGWYNLDATWGDPINDYDSSYIRYTYFLVPDKWIHNISHYNVNQFMKSDGTWIKCFDAPTCSKTASNYFSKKGIYCSTEEEADAAIKKAIDRAAKDKKNVVEIRVSSDELFNKLTESSAVISYKKYAQSVNSSVSSVRRNTSDTYKNMGIIYYDLVY